MDVAAIDELPPPQAMAFHSSELFAEGHRHDWLVLHVKSRQEKALSQDLAVRGIEHFLPLSVEHRSRNGRSSRVEAPLFPGYVFLRGTLDEAFAADRTKRVAQIIRVNDQTRLNRELSNLQLALNSGTPLKQHEWLRRGLRVEVVSGPLRGLQGLVEDRRSLERVVLQVNMLGRAVTLEVTADCLSIVD